MWGQCGGRSSTAGADMADPATCCAWGRWAGEGGGLCPCSRVAAGVSPSGWVPLGWYCSGLAASLVAHPLPPAGAACVHSSCQAVNEWYWQCKPGAPRWFNGCKQVGGWWVWAGQAAAAAAAAAGLYPALCSHSAAAVLPGRDWGVAAASSAAAVRSSDYGRRLTARGAPCAQLYMWEQCGGINSGAKSNATDNSTCCAYGR
jgi:hypothetical protein